MLISKPLPNVNYFEEEQRKDLIVLHFTAGGSADGAFATFANRSRVSVPYIVTPGGDIWQLFDDKLWAYHLGIKGANNPAHVHDKRSIGIEIVNWGPLRRRGDYLYAWPGNWETKICDVAETSRYAAVDYRGEHYFQVFTASQITAVVSLVGSLRASHTIQRVIPRAENRFAMAADMTKVLGVASHVNFRDDKTDLAPVQSDLIWSKLTQAGFVEA